MTHAQVTAVQPHLKKCFEGVNRLEFHVSGKEVSASAMYSVEGECVIWPEPLKIKGNVESWLTDVESMMRESLRFRLREATNDYMEKPRTQWVLDWDVPAVPRLDSNSASKLSMGFVFSWLGVKVEKF